MSRMSIATPCPIPFSAKEARRSSTAASTENESTLTGEIDYTRVIAQGFRNAQPRRKSTFPRKAERQATVTIFEDVAEDEELILDYSKAPALAGTTLLGKPAQKRQTVYVPKAEDKNDIRPLGEIGQARRRASIAPSARIEKQAEQCQTVPPGQINGALKKDPRRRTIFVPAEDTTILTIHPGAYNTHKLDDTFQLPNLNVQPPPSDESTVVSPARPEQAARRARVSLSAAPKRIPLQHVEVKQNVPAVDVRGQNGGKENVPPGCFRNSAENGKPAKFIAPASTSIRNVSRPRLHESIEASQARRTAVARRTMSVAKPRYRPQQSENVRSRPRMQDSALRDECATQILATQSDPLAQPKIMEHRYSSKKESIEMENDGPRWPAVDRNTCVSKLAQFPVLSEDVSHPQLYEESWLSHQEIALTELINDIFDSAVHTREHWYEPETSLRGQLLKIYQQPHVVMLHKRLQSSLLYGALSLPKGMSDFQDPATDIGLRRQLLSLWLDNYEEEPLRAAAEAVVGRQVPRKGSSLPQSETHGGYLIEPCKTRRALIGFLETFFVNIDDLDDADNLSKENHRNSQRWRKRILRSLLLIWLLDRAKAGGIVSKCLHKTASTIKSSTSTLYALSRLLLPSIGDVVRVLRHLDYEVTSFQDPLNEVLYHIGNIAIDLRDGVYLTRLVEVLLYANEASVPVENNDATVTILLPDATVLESLLFAADGSRCPRVLSQHLKIPCLGRAQKLHNVQLALRALECHARWHMISHITADDVVDGHREKTMSLLWVLVSNYGLTHLVDWEELKSDIKRVSSDCIATEDVQSQRARENLLQAWATAHCMQTNVEVTNLTTSFVGGRAYAAILDAFATILPRVEKAPGSVTSLEARLRYLGCSAAFGKQLAASTSAIPSRSTTVSSLAFLASRLLPLARRNNAATVIKRAFRLRLSSVRMSQRLALMRVAHACAAVVKMRERLIKAATVVQRAWRRAMDARMTRLNLDVSAFQTCARRWLIRQRIGCDTLFDIRKTQSFRVMGGW